MLLKYYEAIEQASQDKRRTLKGRGRQPTADARGGGANLRLMQRIVLGDVQIRFLGEARLTEPDGIPAAQPKPLQ